MSDMTIKVGADTSQFNSALRGIQNSVGNLNSALAALGVGAAAYKLASFGKDLVINSSKAAASFETLKIQLEVLAGSASKAGDLLSQMTEYGAKTPLELKDIQEAGKMLMAFGIETENVMGILKMLGDVSMGDAQKLLSLSRAFGQMSAAGKATMEDINQMVDAGFNPLIYVSKVTGEQMQDLRDRVSDGGVSVKEISNAFKMATGEGGRFHNMLLRVAGTTEGRMSNLRDAINGLQKAFGASFNVGLDVLLDKANNIIPTFKDAADRLGTQAANLLIALAEHLPDGLAQIQKAISEAGGIWAATKQGLIRVLEDTQVKDAVKSLFGSMLPQSARMLADTVATGATTSSSSALLMGSILRFAGGKGAVGKVGSIMSGVGLQRIGETASEKEGSNVMNIMLEFAGIALAATAAVSALKGAFSATTIAVAALTGPVTAAAAAVGMTAAPFVALVAALAAASAAIGYFGTKLYLGSKEEPVLFAKDQYGEEIRGTGTQMAIPNIAPIGGLNEFKPEKFTGEGLLRQYTPYKPTTSAEYAELIRQNKIANAVSGVPKMLLRPGELPGGALPPFLKKAEEKKEEAANATIQGFKPFLTARAAVGGGMFFTGKDTAQSLAKATNQYLAKIENNTRRLTPSWT